MARSGHGRACRSASTLLGVVDFRSDKSNTNEGAGKARALWDSYVRVVNVPFAPLTKRVAERWTHELVGFYVAWHLYGGFEGLVDSGMSPATVWRKVKRFRTITAEHPDEYRMPGVTINPAAYWDDAR
jgi:hypothetical protein